MRTNLISSAVLLLAIAVDVQAQQTPGPEAAPAAATAETKITLDLRDVPFRTALEALFEKTGLQYAVEPQVPNTPVRLTIRDIDFTTALRTVTRLGGATYRKEGPIYVVGLRQVPPPQPVAEEVAPETAPVETGKQVIWEKIPILFNSYAVIGQAFGALGLPTEIPQSGSSGYSGGYGGFGGGFNSQNGLNSSFGGLNGGLGSGLGGLNGGLGGLGSGFGGQSSGLGGLGSGLSGLAAQPVIRDRWHAYVTSERSEQARFQVAYGLETGGSPPWRACWGTSSAAPCAIHHGTSTSRSPPAARRSTSCWA